MRMPVIVFGLLILVLAAACSSTSSVQEVRQPNLTERISDPGRCRVYVYRSDQQLFAASSLLWIADGDTVVGGFGTDEYLVWERNPGTTRLRMYVGRSFAAGDDKEGVELLECEAGQVYYCYVSFPGPSRRPKVTFKMARVAEQELKSRTPAPQGMLPTL